MANTKKFQEPDFLKKMTSEEKRDYFKISTNLVEGIGVTYSIGSDAYAYHVTEVIKPGKMVKIQQLHEVNTGDWFGDQNWELFIPENNNSCRYLKFWKGSWKECYENGNLTHSCGYYHVGYAHSRRDPSF